MTVVESDTSVTVMESGTSVTVVGRDTVDVEHGSRLFVLPYGRVSFTLSTTKNGRVITVEVLYEGKFTFLYGNMIFMMFCCSPS